MLGVLHGLPRRQKEAHCDETLREEIGFDEIFPPLVVLARRVGPGPERGSHVLEIVPDDSLPVVRDERVERVARLHVHQVRPGAEHLQRAQLAAMLVGDDVVRVVRTGPVVPESADRTPGNRASGDRAVRSVRAPLGSPQHIVQIALPHRPPLSRRRRDPGVRTDRERIRTDVNEVVLHLPVPERPEDLVGYENGAGRRFGISVGVERHEPRLSPRVLHREAGRKARFLCRTDRPRARRRSPAGQRSPHGLFD